MNQSAEKDFLSKWPHYFPGAEWPLALYYTDTPPADAERVPPPSAHKCLIGVLNRVRNGAALVFGEEFVGCFGGKRYTGFSQQLMPNFDSFLSCGIPGQLEGERYKRSPGIVQGVVQHWPDFEAPAANLVVKRFDRLQEGETPEVIVFLAPPDELSGLFTLANFDWQDPHGVITPFCAGCAAIIQYPYLEGKKEAPRGVVGMFDVSARPFVPRETLSFAVPMNRFRTMVGFMEESFLITKSWDRVRKRMERG